MKDKPRKLYWIVFVSLAVAVALGAQFSSRINRMGDGSMRVEWDSQSGTRYEVYWSSNLDTAWQLMTNITASGSTSIAIDSGSTDRPHPSNSAFRAYRIRESNPTSIFLDITGNITWTDAGSPFLITNIVHVLPGASLTIMPGVRVIFSSTGALYVDGTLRALGSSNLPVVFSSAKTFPTAGDWPGLRFTATSVDAQCVMSNSVVEYAQAGITLVDASPKILNSWIHLNSQQGIHLTRSSPLIQGNIIERNGSYGIYCYDTSSPQILSNRIVVNGSYGLYVLGTSAIGHNSLPVVNGNVLAGNGTYDLIAQSFFQPTNVVVLNARSNWWGTVDTALIASRVYDYTESPTSSPVVDFGNWYLAEGGPAIGGKFVSGPIYGNVVWQLSDSPVGVIGDLLITSNATLTIQAGVEVQVLGNFPIQIDGTLRALGQPGNQVYFTSGDLFPLAGDWQGLRFTDLSVDAQCVLSNAVVEYAQIGINCVDASPKIVDSWIHFNSQQGINLTRSSPLIQGNLVEDNNSYGIRCQDTSSPQILNNQILRNGSYGLYLTGTGAAGRNSEPLVRGNMLAGNTTYDLIAQTFYQPTNVVVIDARSNWWGTVDAELIAGRVYDYTEAPTTSPVVNFGNWYLAQGGPAIGGKFVGGPIYGNTVWQLSDSPVGVIGDLLITSNATLTIQAGVQVRVLGNFFVQVDGALQALGQPASRVVFTSGQSQGVPQPGDWLGIRFTDLSVDAQCVLSNAVVEFAQIGINVVDASPSILNCRVQNSGAQGIYLTRSSPLIQGTVVQNSGSYGIYCYDTSSPQLLNNEIVGNGSYGLYIAGLNSSGHNSLPLVRGNVLAGNTTYDLIAQNFFQPTNVVVIDARSNWWGTVDASLIAARVYDYTDLPTTSPVVDYGNWYSAAGGPAVGGKFVSGPVSSNTVWQLSDSPIRVIGDILVTSNATLTIQAGVEVQFLGNYVLEVAGTLRALGTFGNLITFTSGDAFPLPGDWVGIQFLGSSVDAQCLLSYVVIEFAQVGVNIVDAAPQIVNSWIQDSSAQGIYLTRSSPLIQGNVVQYNGSYGIYCLDTSSPQILNNQIVVNGSYGLYAAGNNTTGHNSLPLVRGNVLAGNGSYDLIAQNFFQPTNLVLIDARSNWWGTADASVIGTRVYDYTDNPSTSPVVDYGNWFTAQGGPAVGGKFVSGPIYSNTVWQASDSPIGVIGDILVTSNATLTIQAGVRLNFLGNYFLQVDGAIQALGASSSNVVFTSGKAVPNAGDWQGLLFSGISVDAQCVLSNAVVEYAQVGINCVDASPQIVNCWIHLNSQQGIYLTRSSPLIQGNAIEINGSYGIYCYDTSSPQILNNHIVTNTSYGLYLAGLNTVGHNSLPLVRGNDLFGNGSYDLIAQSFFQPTNVVIIDARSNWWGTADAAVIANRVYDYTEVPSTSPVVDFGNWFIAQGGPAVGGKFVSGLISSNTVWLASDSPIGVLGNLVLGTNVTLTIQPGVQVQVMGNYPLDINGSLQAVGQSSNRIVFTSGKLVPRKSDWIGLRFNPSSTNGASLLSNVVIEYADVAMNCNQSSPTLTASQLRQNRIGIYLDTASSAITTNLVELNDTGISCYQFSRPSLSGNTVTLNRNNGIEITSSSTAVDRNPQPVLIGNSVFSNSTAGSSWYNLYTYNFFLAATTTLNAVSNWWGTATTNQIEQSVYHRPDNSLSPLVNFAPFLASNVNHTPFGATNSIVWFSPNADGIKDSVTVGASLSHTSAWSVAMVDSAGGTVRSFTGSGPNISVFWDGTNQIGNPAPEGRYRAIIVATNLSDARVSVAYGDFSLIDRTLPVGTGAADTLPDGMVANQLVVRGTASDVGFFAYTVEYGVGISPPSFTLWTSNSAPVIGGILWQLNSLTLSNGIYTIRLRVYDLAGNITTTLFVVQIDNVLITNPASNDIFFDPALGNTQVSFTSDRTNSVIASIHPVLTFSDVAGNLTVTLSPTVIKSYAFAGQLGTNTFTWNGTDNGGNPVTNGVYYYKIFVQAAFGRTNAYNPPYVSGPVTMTNVVVNTNSFNFIGNDPLTISYNLFAPAFVGMGVVPFTTFVPNLPRDAGPHTESFNGRDPITHLIVYGNFQVNAKAEVLPENALVVEHLVAPIVTNLKTESYRIRPSLSQVSQIYYSLSRAADLQIQLRDPNGNFITLQTLTPMAAGSYVLEWDGSFDTLSKVSSEGDYEVILQALDALNYQETKTANLSVY